MNELIIVGAGGLGREVAWLAERINSVSPTWDIKGFIDDDDEIMGKEINGYQVLGKTSDITSYPDAYYVCAVGFSKVREKIVERMKSLLKDIKFATLIDPSVTISELVTIGEGTIICAQSVITVNIAIGEHVIINPGCTVGHDAVLQDFVILYPGVNVAGATNIGYCSELGTGMQIIQGKRVGGHSIVGAGAVVVKDIPDNCTAVGCPAKPIKYHD